MKSRWIPKAATAALALILLSLSVSCLYPRFWRGPGWRGPGHYHRW